MDIDDGHVEPSSGLGSRGPQVRSDGSAGAVADELSPLGPIADDLAGVLALRAVADQLEDAAVERALRAGWSWSQVAEALGVTRQAVHKRHLRRIADAGIDVRRRHG